MNQLTHWLDGSNIYGSEHEEAENLREKRDGLLKSTKKEGNEMLPQCDDAPLLKLFSERDGEDEPMEACKTCGRQDACSKKLRIPAPNSDFGNCCFIGGKTFAYITWTKVMIIH